ncbi:MAG: response regulator [Pseudomonadota bacterium]|nr:response regulator [Pseudomonadota bacterium]
MKIFMIVDDSPVIRKVGRRLIEDLGFVVVEAEDAEQAIIMARENMPDGILVDWSMPGQSGIGLLQELHNLPGASDLKSLFCTSALDVPEMTRAKRAGASGFIMKPFNRKVLQEKLLEVGLLDDMVGESA